MIAPLTRVLDAREAGRTAEFIAREQCPDGQIPWFAGERTDPWDHVEAAMGLDIAGRHPEARAAYQWLRRTQNPDGSWCRGYRGSRVVDHVREANFTAYVAVGLWHHYLCTGDDALLERMWPTLAKAIDFVLRLQAPGGEIRWALDGSGAVADEALLTGCASMYHSLRCALAIAEYRGVVRPDWELAAAALSHAIVAHPTRFADRDRFSMDWYYPVLGGAVRGAAAVARIDHGWDRFVVPDLGVRCVDDEPWVTGAETSELVLALCAVGEHGRAAETFTAMQHLRHDDGSYWTGYVYRDRAHWPVERTTWTAGAVLLADAMLAGDAATTAVFGAASLPAGPDEAMVACEERCAIRTEGPI
jgi:hypothetical protein